MAIFRMKASTLEPLVETSFAAQGIRERAHLQQILRESFATVAEDVLIIDEECDRWESRRRIDLLGIDRNANLVVIELKRDAQDGLLQAIHYAALASSLTAQQVIDGYQRFLDKHEGSSRAIDKLSAFLGSDPLSDPNFPHDVRIMLVAEDFQKDLTTAVLWLSDRQIDVRCVRLKPYLLDGELVIDAQQVLPLAQAQDYVDKLRERAASRREVLRESGTTTGYWMVNAGENGRRNWDDCVRYGFMAAGGGPQWIRELQRLEPGDRFFAYVNGEGFMGLGEVLERAVPLADFVPSGDGDPLVSLPLAGLFTKADLDLETGEWCIAVRWESTAQRGHGILKERAVRGTVKRLHQADLVQQLLERFSATDPR